MDPVRSAMVEPGFGLIGNANRGGRRQITIIASRRWAELMEAPGWEALVSKMGGLKAPNS